MVKLPADISSSLMPMVLTTSLGWPSVAAADVCSLAGEPGCASGCCVKTVPPQPTVIATDSSSEKIRIVSFPIQTAQCKTQTTRPPGKYHPFADCQSIELACSALLKPVSPIPHHHHPAVQTDDHPGRRKSPNGTRVAAEMSAERWSAGRSSKSRCSRRLRVSEPARWPKSRPLSVACCVDSD